MLNLKCPSSFNFTILKILSKRGCWKKRSQKSGTQYFKQVKSLKVKCKDHETLIWEMCNPIFNLIFNFCTDC